MTEIPVHIRVLFQLPKPEMLIKSIDTEKNPSILSSQAPSRNGYLHYARSAMLECSDDELVQFYYDLKLHMESRPKGGIFSLLGLYSTEILRFFAGVPKCRLDKLLEWREISLNLGQDLFTCAGLAWKDVEEGCRTTSFCWPAAVRTDYDDLYHMLSQQISENHYHLNGSTHSFPLTWGFLMNHPAQISRYFSGYKFEENLQQSAHFGPGDNVLSWKERVLYAAWLRAYLFLAVRSPELRPSAKAQFLHFSHSIGRLDVTRQQVETLRFQYGARFKQLNGLTKCLDYAIFSGVEYERPYAVRFLSGERQFLYECFKCCFTEYCPAFQDMFYLYLLIKLQFRQEIIQSNKRYGFRNFSDYQDRKGNVWGDFPEYWSESYRLSISSVLRMPVHSLEMRVMAGNTIQNLESNISLPDQYAYFHFLDLEGKLALKDSSNSYRQYARDQTQHFFVLHFAKIPLEMIAKDNISLFLPKARHNALRKAVQSQAMAIARSMERDDYLCSRIRGIDAASHEIGCRPEVFATAFRFLRGFSPVILQQKARYWPLIGATYHVGEDFLDIVDGLRAIDESIFFLNLERGDRIGHALALGIDPKSYYDLKSVRIVMPAQDLLDNLVWLLFRCMDWGISIPHMFRAQLEQRAYGLFRRLYGENSPNTTLRDYYHSWILRGDDPSLVLDPALWSDALYTKPNTEFSLHRYSQFKKNNLHFDGMDLEILRANRSILQLLYLYHFGQQERLLGQVPESFQISDDYAALVTKIQDHMMRRLMEQGICIECNPSSNYLIGTFRSYDKHPMFRFNSFGLNVPEHTDESIQLRVSINTDDQGIFDTSLENEYALMYCGLCMRKDASNRNLFSHDAVYSYLDHIRTLGNGMVFPKAKQQFLSRSYI